MSITKGSGSRKPQKIAKWIFVIVLAVVIIQIAAFLLGNWYPAWAKVKMGPAILLLVVLGAVMIPFLIIQKQVDGKNFSKNDWIAIFVLAGVLVLLMLKLRILVPEAFMGAINQIQAIFGIGFI